MYPGLKGRLTDIREKQLFTAGRAKVVFPTSKHNFAKFCKH
ncbi:UNVERIFIED_ORG: hypothetical protein ABIC97_003740 [Peribacillus simplex]